MAGVRLLHRIHRQASQAVDDLLIPTPLLLMALSRRLSRTHLVQGLVLLGLAEDHILCSEMKTIGSRKRCASIVRALRSAMKATEGSRLRFRAHSKALYKAARHGPWAL